MSRTYEPDDPELGAKRVRPFRAHELEHIPREHRDIFKALLYAMPEAMFTQGFLRQVCDVVRRHTEMDVEMWLDSVRIYETARLRPLIPGTTCLLIIGLAPRSEKIVVEVHLDFVYRVVASMLGTKGAGLDIHRPLTEIEQGVFLFVALKVMALLNDGWANPEQVAIRIEDIRSDLRGAADVLRLDHHWLCVSWKLVYDMEVGAVRAFVPSSLAGTMFLLRLPPGSPHGERARDRIRQRLAPFSHEPVEGWVEIGRIELTRPDLAQLDPGDIVLLEGSQSQLTDGVVNGPAFMRIGLGRRGALRGYVHVQDGKHVFEIQEIIIEETPETHDPQQGHGELGDPEGVVAAYEDGAAPGYEGGEESYQGYSDDESSEGEAAADDDAYDEDWGIDDEDDGDDEEYSEDYNYEEQQGYDDQDGGDYQEGGDDQGQQGYEGDGQAYQEGAGGEGQVADDNLGEMEPLLGDIPMVVVVELGRVQLTADEVVRLRPGQLIELGRSPADPVDLVVNGKLVAKGELVEIEGALGVRLVSLAKGEVV